MDQEHSQFAGYVTGFDPAEFADVEAVRAELGYRPDEKVCIATVGGSGVGTHVPLRHHFEQNFHVRRRLERYRAGRPGGGRRLKRLERSSRRRRGPRPR